MMETYFIFNLTKTNIIHSLKHYSLYRISAPSYVYWRKIGADTKLKNTEIVKTL